MSYDIYLEVDGGGREPIEVYWSNYTSNVAPMWRRAMPDTDGVAGLHGMAATDVVPLLERGIAYFNENQADLDAMNPENGWGDREGAVLELVNLLSACRDYPKTTIRISR
jgi:hypothetical protein